jgi:hypothetical protein
MTIRHIKHRILQRPRPPLRLPLPTTRTQPAITTKIHDTKLITTRTIIHKKTVIALFTREHLLHLNTLNLTNNTPVPIPIHIPVMIIQKDILDRKQRITFIILRNNQLLHVCNQPCKQCMS